MIRFPKLGTLLAPMAVLASTAMPTQAQVAVFDGASIIQQIQQFEQGAQQLLALQQQLTQAQQLYGSLNKITNMADVASILNNPAIRQVLPPDFASVEGLLTGKGTGAAGASQQSLLQGNTTYTSPGNDFYASALQSRANATAGSQALAQQMYDASTARIAGIDQLRQQISVSQDPKTTMDLTARLSAESSFLQADTLRMQALRMVQQAQLDVAQQQAEQQWRQRLDGIKAQTTP